MFALHFSSVVQCEGSGAFMVKSYARRAQSAFSMKDYTVPHIEWKCIDFLSCVCVSLFVRVCVCTVVSAAEAPQDTESEKAKKEDWVGKSTQPQTNTL